MKQEKEAGSRGPAAGEVGPWIGSIQNIFQAKKLGVSEDENYSQSRKNVFDI